MFLNRHYHLPKNFPLRTLATACLILLAASASVFGADAVSLINGKDLTDWKFIGKDTSQWVYGKAVMNPDHPAKLMVVGPGVELISTNRTVNLSSKTAFGDCHVEVEFMVGKSTPEVPWIPTPESR